MAYWPWLNGYVDTAKMVYELKEMKDEGMRRPEIWDVAVVNNPDNYIPAGPAFMSDSSVVLIEYALKEGKKYGIEIGMVGSSGWNAGAMDNPQICLQVALLL
ncbi:MAG: hypothetical protein ACQER7_12445 [Bacteroidota bacterium]